MNRPLGYQVNPPDLANSVSLTRLTPDKQLNLAGEESVGGLAAIVPRHQPTKTRPPHAGSRPQPSQDHNDVQSSTYVCVCVNSHTRMNAGLWGANACVSFGAEGPSEARRQRGGRGAGGSEVCRVLRAEQTGSDTERAGPSPPDLGPRDHHQSASRSQFHPVAFFLVFFGHLWKRRLHLIP